MEKGITWETGDKIYKKWIKTSSSFPTFQFDNDRVTLLLRSEPGNPNYIMQNGSCSIVDQRFLYEKYESEFEEGEGEGEGVLDPQQIEEDLFNHGS